MISGVMTRADIEACAHWLDGEAVALTAAEIARRGIRRVWVDGFSAAGKTHFSKTLAMQLGWRNVDLDGLLAKGRDAPRFADRVDGDRLSALLATSAGVIVHGVCVREALDGLDDPATALHVYVARVTRPIVDHYLWHDWLDMDAPASDRDPWLYEDVRRYHREHAPHTRADLVFVRVAD